MKTKKDFINKFSRNPELAKNVLQQMTASWADLTAYPNNYTDASAGVGGFIYHTETVAFAKKNMVLIIKALNELEQETGAPLNKPTDDETQFYNWMAWFALETITHEIADYMEME